MLYVIHWEKTQLDYTLEKGPSSGRLEKVSGELYRDGKLASRFTADAGYANQAKEELRLEGRVRVVSETALDPKQADKERSQATLTCDRVLWKTADKLLKAYGGVKIDFKVLQAGKPEKAGGTMGPMDELWCLPDLAKAGTPGFDWGADIQRVKELEKKGAKR